MLTVALLYLSPYSIGPSGPFRTMGQQPNSTQYRGTTAESLGFEFALVLDELGRRASKGGILVSNGVDAEEKGVYEDPFYIFNSLQSCLFIKLIYKPES